MKRRRVKVLRIIPLLAVFIVLLMAAICAYNIAGIVVFGTMTALCICMFWYGR